MRSPGVTRANDCSTLCLCSYGSPNLPRNPLCVFSCKSNCAQQPQIGLDGLPLTKISGPAMVEALTIDRREIASCPFDELNSSRFTMPNDILWPLAPAQPGLGATDVHVWAAHLDLSPGALASLAAILSEPES